MGKLLNLCFVAAFIALYLLSYVFPNYFDKEILGIQYLGYHELEFRQNVIKGPKYFNFGLYSLRIRYFTLDIDSIQTGRTAPVWSNPIDSSFIACGRAQPKAESFEDSFYLIDDSNLLNLCKKQIITSIEKSGDYSLLIMGTFRDCPDVSYMVQFSELEGADLKPKLGIEAKCLNSGFNRIYFRTRSTPTEGFFGFGEQFSYANLKGRIIPILVREKGVGRGDEPLTTFANAFFHGAGGRSQNSYAPAPFTVTSHNRSIFLETAKYSIWDLQDEWSCNILVWDSQFSAKIINGPDMKKILGRNAQSTGLMKILPSWTQNGVIIGIQGGTKKVLEMQKMLEANDVPVAGFWIQDWVGKRQSLGYSRLWWNWEVDEQHYPGWNEMVSHLKESNIRVLTYVNPMLTDVTDKKHYSIQYYYYKQEKNLFQEAVEKNYLIHRGDKLFQTRAFSDFKAGLLDITNPEAVSWYKNIIKQTMLNQSGVFGFMADFGEAAPLSSEACQLYDWNSSLIEFHNSYPVLWNRLVQEAITEHVFESEQFDDDYVFFTRSGFTQSPNYTKLLWAGDQNQNWGRHNGIKSALVAMLSGGMSGYTLNHADIGGYTHILPVLNEFYAPTNRDQDLLQRWLELCAFTAMFRSHEGNKPEDTLQIYDHRLIHSLRRNTYLFKLLGTYRFKQLMKQASKVGLPLMRHLVLEFQSDQKVFDIVDQFMYGSELMVAPVLEPRTFERMVYFPKLASKYVQNFWVDVWTGEKIYGCACYMKVKAPYDQQPAFYPILSDWGESLQDVFNKVKKIN